MMLVVWMVGHWALQWVDWLVHLKVDQLVSPMVRRLVHWRAVSKVKNSVDLKEVY